LFHLIENFKNGFITHYFNLNILLITVIISGVITVSLKREEDEKEIKKIKKRDYVFIIILGVVAAGVIYYRTKEIGILSYVISVISGIIIILLSILFLTKSEQLTKEE